MNVTWDSQTNSAEPSGTQASELRVLLAELGADDVESALEAIRHLKTQAGRGAAEGGRNDENAVAAGDAKRMLEKFRAFSSRIDSLNGTIASMEDQLRNLYADRERLESEIGASEVEDVIAAFSNRAMTIELLEAQLATLYADREYLDSELGKSEPTEIVSMFRTVATMVTTAHRELVA